MKKPVNAEFRNRGLLPQEEPVVKIVNDALLTSARKHGLILTSAARFTIKNAQVAGQPVRRAKSGDVDEILQWPLAAQA